MNVKGDVIAKDVATLHSDMNNLKKETALTEKGATINGVGDTPNQHDILTGSQADGTLQAAAPNRMRPAATGRVPPTAPARRNWATSTVRAVARQPRRGTQRTLRAAARRPTW